MVKQNTITVLSFFAVLSIFSKGILSDAQNVDVADEFAKAEIVPQLIEKAPAGIIQITWPEGAASFGNEITPTGTRETPVVTLEGTDEDSLYTLIMIDPDIPTRQNPDKHASWLHWLVVNISRSDINNGDQIATYHGVAPPQRYGFHRYIFLLYKQDGQNYDHELRHSEETILYKRLGWSVRDFVKRHNLGDPIAGNYIQSQYDESVEAFYKKYGLEMPTRHVPYE